METKLFFELCLKNFIFLIDDYDFKIKQKKSDGGIDKIIYQNITTAIEIRFEWKEWDIFVELYRLTNGKITEDPIVIEQNSKLNSFYLDTLLEIRAPKLKIIEYYNYKKKTSLDDSDVKDLIKKYASALSKYGKDILQGDFSIFKQLEKIVKKRAQELKKEKKEGHGG